MSAMNSQNLQELANLLSLTYTVKKMLASSDAALLSPDEKESILAILNNACAQVEVTVALEAHAEYGDN
jgi:hypothetical protein